MNERTCPFSSYRDSDADRFPDYRSGLRGLRRGLHGLQARITRITGADYADYITPIMKLIYALKLSGMHVVVRNSL